MWDCIIVGGGPAGLTAATYLGRFQRDVLLVDAGESRLKRIPLTRNTPGFPEGIAGLELLSRLQDQASRYGALFRAGEIEEIESGSDGFRVRIGTEWLAARTVLVATGAKLTEPPIARLDEGLRRGLVRYCPICDAYEARGQRIAVLGGRPGAIAEARFLRTYSEDVAFLHLEGSEPARRELEEAKDAGIHVDSRTVADVNLSEKVQVRFSDDSIEEFDTLYPCLGCAPRSDLARHAGAGCSDQGGLLVDAHQQTSVPGLYAAGDVLQGLDQIASACGQAAIAAVAIHNALR
jgi:thioredoxin reductase (NADPH)